MAKSSRYPRILPRLPRNGELFDLLVVDRHLTRICERLKVLKFITPVNARDVRERFLKGELRNGEPPFEYRHEEEDVDDLKADLHAVPIRSESALGQLYRRKRDELHDILTMLQARGTAEFRERSRLLYGTTTAEELDALTEWMALEPDAPEDSPLSAREALGILRGQLVREKLTCAVRLRHGLSSSAAAGEQSIAVRNDATFSHREVERIFVHEAETHILRFRNGERQPLRALFYHGFPRHSDAAGNYLFTEEGLATFQEEVSGVLTNDRRRLLAGRALAVWLMDHDNLGFSEVFEALTQRGFDEDTAFSVAERTFRGGGYTKDHIYYSGYIRVREAILGGNVDLNLLFLGKIGLEWLDMIAEFHRDGDGILHPPRHLPRWVRRLVTHRREEALATASSSTGDGFGSEPDAVLPSSGSDGSVSSPGWRPLTLDVGELPWLGAHTAVPSSNASARRHAVASDTPTDSGEEADDLFS